MNNNHVKKGISEEGEREISLTDQTRTNKIENTNITSIPIKNFNELVFPRREWL